MGTYTTVEIIVRDRMREARSQADEHRLATTALRSRASRPRRRRRGRTGQEAWR